MYIISSTHVDTPELSWGTNALTSEQHAGSTRHRAVSVAGHALVDAEVVGLRTEHGQREVTVVRAGRSHPASVRQQFLVAVPRHGWPRPADQVHSECAAVAHVVRLVSDLLLEDRRETYNVVDRDCLDTALTCQVMDPARILCGKTIIFLTFVFDQRRFL